MRIGVDLGRRVSVEEGIAWAADNNGAYELHMQPGTGTVDFGAMFKLLEDAGFTGHYMCDFGSLDDMLARRDDMIARAREAGARVD